MECNRQALPVEQLKQCIFIKTSQEYLLMWLKFTSNNKPPPLEWLARTPVFLYFIFVFCLYFIIYQVLSRFCFFLFVEFQLFFSVFQ